MLSEENFRRIFQTIMDTYDIPEEIAAELLQKILLILQRDDSENDLRG